MGQARRDAGIPESDYIRPGDTVGRIATIRCLARILGPPDARYEHPTGCSLSWHVERKQNVWVNPNGSITS